MKKSFLLLAVFCLSIISSFAQIRVEGVVKDETNEPLPGATVTILGTTTGTITDIDGEFQISVPSNDTELVFSFLGFVEQRRVVGNQTFIEIQLTTDALQMDEVIVLGYGVVRRSNVIGAISSVGEDEFKDRPVSGPVQALQGKASGVSITQNSGAPGEGSRINIRGVGTINNSDPLYVVDGIVSSGIGHINPSDIETIEILKDAASAAIYGAKGANGVVIVNTKSAKAGELRVNADFYYGAKQFWNRIDVLDSYEWHIHNMIRGGQGAPSFAGLPDAINSGPGAYYQTLPNINWLDEISQEGVVQKANVNISQGTEKINYYFSAGLYDEKGLIRTSGHQKNNFLLKVQAKPADRVTMDLKASYQGSSTSNVAGEHNSILRDALIAAPQYIYDQYDGFMLDNPLKKIEQNYNKENRDRFDLSADLKVELAEGLIFQSRVGFEHNTNGIDIYEPIDPKYEMYLSELGDFQKPTIKNELYRNKSFLWENIVNYNQSFGKHDLGLLAFNSIDNSESFKVRGEGDSFLYNNTNFSAMDLVAYNRQLKGNPGSERNIGFGSRVTYGYDNRYLLEVNFRADASSKFPSSTRWGYFPSLSLGWRVDQESFMQSMPWISQLKPRASIGQSGNNRIGDEDQFTIYKNNHLYTFGTTNSNLFYDGYFADNIGNESLLWEKTTTYNVALDFGFFNSVFGSVEYFNRQTTDMLIRVPVTDATGFNTYPRQNGGDILNTGIELELGYRKKIGDFGLNVRGNISFIQNEVTKLGESDDPIYGGKVNNPGLGDVTYTAVGQPIGQFYGFVIDTENPIYRTREDVLADPMYAGNVEAASKMLGTFRFLDLDGDGRISANDKTIIGSPHPDFFGGLNTDFTYKNFSLNMFWQYSYGNEVFNVLKYWLDVGGTNQSNNGKGQMISNKRRSNIGQFINIVEDNVPIDPVYNPDNRATANLLALQEGNARLDENFLIGNKASTFFIEDASYLRLKNITLSYNLNKTLAQRMRLSNMRLFMGVENLITITDYSGLDPEIGSTRGAAEANTSMGIDYGTFPQARTIFFGLSLGL